MIVCAFRSFRRCKHPVLEDSARLAFLIAPRMPWDVSPVLTTRQHHRRRCTTSDEIDRTQMATKWPASVLLLVLRTIIGQHTT